MERLCGATYDKNMWNVEELSNYDYFTYKLNNGKNKNDCYFFNVVGFEQVSDDEFLVLTKYTNDLYKLVRYKVGYYTTFERLFSKYEFINDDKILFSNKVRDGEYICSGIYSIKDNKVVDEVRWINGLFVDTYINEDDENDLYLEKVIPSSILDNPKLLFTIRSNGFKLDNICYSQLRDSFIEVNSKEDIKRIENEDKRYVRLIEEHLSEKIQPRKRILIKDIL